MFGFLVAIDGGGAAVFGAPLVGFLAEFCFNYNINQSPSSAMDSATRKQNTDALAKSILIAVVIPWSLCFVWFGCLHRTYPQDRAKVNPI